MPSIKAAWLPQLLEDCIRAVTRCGSGPMKRPCRTLISITTADLARPIGPETSFHRTARVIGSPQSCGLTASSGVIQVPVALEKIGIVGTRKENAATASVNAGSLRLIPGSERRAAIA